MKRERALELINKLAPDFSLQRFDNYTQWGPDLFEAVKLAGEAIEVVENYEELKIDLVKLRDELYERNRVIDAFVDEVESLRAQVKDTENKVSRLENENDRLEKHISELESEIDNLNTQLEVN